MIHRLLRVARREYLAYVRTKTFLVSVLMLPLIFALAFGLPAIMESMPKPPKPFTVIDQTGEYGEDLYAALYEQAGLTGGILKIDMRDHILLQTEQLDLPADRDARMARLQELAIEGELFAYFVIAADEKGPGCRLGYYSTDPSAHRLPRVLQGILEELIAQRKLGPLVADPELLSQVLHGVSLHTHAITEEGEEVATAAHIARSYAPLAFVYLLWIAILTMASHLMTSTIEEKSSRIVEVILSSVSSFEFMLGKLVGLAGAGLTMILAWVCTAGIVSAVIPNATAQQILSGLGGAFSGLTIFWFLGFFLLGFLFYASLYVGVGSVCNTLRDAQNLLQPVMIVMMIPLFLMFYVTNNPDHIVAVVGSFIPPFTPFLMMNRIPAQPPAPTWQILLAALIMILATWATISAAAKVFRVGILMYGKAPTLPEILRWARQKS
ncbi:MAG: ABC transporter permease [Candidatus Eisenbacteria sp.]|nr:ABC transporter permease [Candidatus Eisenbacteria bacterium]